MLIVVPNALPWICAYRPTVRFRSPHAAIWVFGRVRQARSLLTDRGKLKP